MALVIGFLVAAFTVWAVVFAVMAGGFLLVQLGRAVIATVQAAALLLTLIATGLWKLGQMGWRMATQGGSTK